MSHSEYEHDGTTLAATRPALPYAVARRSERGHASYLGWRIAAQLAGARSAIANLPLRLHRDQRGTISIVGVFTLLALVILLGMVMNTGQQVDQKIKMQNAADAATYSGGVVLARNMNSLAFTNQLLSEVFALTAFMREAQARRAESLTPEIARQLGADWPVHVHPFRVLEIRRFGTGDQREDPSGTRVGRRSRDGLCVQRMGGSRLGADAAGV